MSAEVDSEQNLIGAIEICTNLSCDEPYYVDPIIADMVINEIKLLSIANNPMPKLLIEEDGGLSLTWDLGVVKLYRTFDEDGINDKFRFLK